MMQPPFSVSDQDARLGDAVFVLLQAQQAEKVVPAAAVEDLLPVEIEVPASRRRLRIPQWIYKPRPKPTVPIKVLVPVPVPLVELPPLPVLDAEILQQLREHIRLLEARVSELEQQTPAAYWQRFCGWIRSFWPWR